MGAVCADYDNDGDTDIMIANDVAENFLWQNDGTGKFKEVGLMTALHTISTERDRAVWAWIAEITTTTDGWTFM